LGKAVALACFYFGVRSAWTKLSLRRVAGKLPKHFRKDSQAHLIWFTSKKLYFNSSQMCGTNMLVLVLVTHQ
jgi:hypothetical protein